MTTDRSGPLPPADHAAPAPAAHYQPRRVTRAAAHEHVAADLRAAIMSGQLAQGARLLGCAKYAGSLDALLQVLEHLCPNPLRSPPLAIGGSHLHAGMNAR